MGLILGGVSASDLILDGQSVSLYVGGSPPVKVWPTRETVQITLGTDLEARDQFRAALADRGLDHTTITEVPFDIELVGTGSARDMFRACSALTTVPDMDTSGVTNMRSMFNACNALTSVPAMDTSSVTNMGWMFTHCYALTTVPAMDTSNVTAMNNMFDYASALTYVPDLDTSQVTNMSHMLFGCAALTDGNVRLIGRHPQVDTTKMILNSGLTFEPFVETVQITLGTGTQAQNQFRAALTARGLNYQTVTRIPFDIELVGTGSTGYMFDGCAALTSVPAMDTSQVTDMYHMFSRCTSLTYVPDMATSNVTDVRYMFYHCAALTDGNVRLIGRHPNVNTRSMTSNSGLTREPFVEVVQITLSAGFAARDQLRAAITARGLDYTTITRLPFEIELVGSGEAIQLFRDCHALTTIPPIDTSQVTNANGMFQECHSLVTVPPLDTSNVVRAPSMFAYCRSLTSVPTMDAAKMIDVTNMFTGCLALTDGNVLLTNRNPAVTSTNMIASSGLTREPWGTVEPPVARTVTINGGPSGWDQAAATGDTGLIQEWFGGNRVRFHAPTRCNQRVYDGTVGLVLVNAGDIIPAGAPVQPLSYNGPYVFTEVI